MSEIKKVLETDHPMKVVKIDKVVVNMAVGISGERLLKAAKVLEELADQKPIFRKAKETVREFGIRKGENIACIVTLREDKAVKFLEKALSAVNYTIKESSIDQNGNFAFGVREHIYLPGVKYDPVTGIFGFDVLVTLSKPGYRVSKRSRRRSRVGKKQRVTREEARAFITKCLGTKLV